MGLEKGSNKHTQTGNASGTTITTNTQHKPTIRTSEQIMLPEMFGTSKQEIYQTTISSVQDFLANHSAMLESGEVSKISVANCFLRLKKLLKLKNLYLYSLRTLEGYLVTNTGKLTKSSFRNWRAWGMTFNGWCLTANFMECPKTASACSLSHILEEQVDQRFYLSDKIQARFKKYLKKKGWPGLSQQGMVAITPQIITNGAKEQSCSRSSEKSSENTKQQECLP